jgi:hypothetical protein
MHRLRKEEVGQAKEAYPIMDGFAQGPERGIEVTLMLADYVAAANGSLTIVGGGANVTGPNAPHSIAMLFGVPWHLTNEKHGFQLELIDVDGNSVAPNGGDEPLVVKGEFEAGRPPGARSGMTFPVVVPLNLGPLGLPPHRQYEWRLLVDGNAREDWRLVFYTTPPIQQAEAA